MTENLDPGAFHSAFQNHGLLPPGGAIKPASLAKRGAMSKSIPKNVCVEYRRLYGIDPMSANVFLLLYELADEEGQVETTEEGLACLMAARFEDPTEYSL